MKLGLYIKDKILNILIYLFNVILILLILKLFKINNNVLIIIFLINFFTGLIIFLINFFQKKNYYNSLINNLDRLDKKYLVLETIPKPVTYEEKIINNILYDINKSMIENIKLRENNILEFKEFIELWIHEIKMPISSLVLKCHNNKEKYGKDLINIVRKIDNYADEVLYYVRSENTEKDFLITKVSLKDVIRNVVLKNKDDLLENNIDLEMGLINYYVYTDKKWLEYILNQIINNSIKYKKGNNSLIKIDVINNEKVVKLIIYDNGIGISSCDIKKVFNKSFTGINGRMTAKSTGIGLYIVKNLINKLGHKIDIESKKDEYTKVIITFGKNDLYDVTKM